MSDVIVEFKLGKELNHTVDRIVTVLNLDKEEFINFIKELEKKQFKVYNTCSATHL